MPYLTARRFTTLAAASLVCVVSVLAMVSCSSDDAAARRTHERPQAGSSGNVYTNDDMSSRRSRAGWWQREAALPPRTAAATAAPSQAVQMPAAHTQVTQAPAQQPVAEAARPAQQPQPVATPAPQPVVVERAQPKPVAVESAAVVEVTPTPRPQQKPIATQAPAVKAVEAAPAQSTAVVQAPGPAPQPQPVAAVETSPEVVAVTPAASPVAATSAQQVEVVEIEPAGDAVELTSANVTWADDHDSLALDRIEPPALLPAEMTRDKPSVTGLDRSHWSKVVVKPTDGTVYHTRTYHDDVRIERKHSPVAHAQGAQDDVEVMLIAATDGPHTHTLSKRNAKALIAQPIEFGLDMIRMPLRMIQNPPHRTETSPQSIEKTALDYRLSDVPAESPDCGHAHHADDEHTEADAHENRGTSRQPARLHDRIRNAGS